MKNYTNFFTIKRLWIILSASLILSFSALLYLGGQIYQQAPPIPNAVKTTNGVIIYSKQDIEDGQNIWQTTGGMQQGSVWGHGSYLAPDWSADWLHREALNLLDVIKSNKYRSNYLTVSEKNALYTGELKEVMRKNTYDSLTGITTVSNDRAIAIGRTEAHFVNLYTSDSTEYKALRENYAFPIQTILNKEKARKLSAFFF